MSAAGDAAGRGRTASLRASGGGDHSLTGDVDDLAPAWQIEAVHEPEDTASGVLVDHLVSELDLGVEGRGRHGAGGREGNDRASSAS